MGNCVTANPKQRDKNIKGKDAVIENQEAGAVADEVQDARRLIDDRHWQREYLKYIHGHGPSPGPHPDPNHIWNTDPK